MTTSLVLDSTIRDWVLLPIVFVTVLVGLGRHYVQQLIASDKTTDKEKAGYLNTLGRSRRIRGNAHFIRPRGFSSRRDHFAAKKDSSHPGVLTADVPGPVNPMMGGKPGAGANNGAMDMMKNQMTFMLPNMVMMAGMSYFFSGFVIAKVPFPLTPRFKMMLQQGINLASLDSSYVSALSWYFLVMFGIRGIFGLILGAGANFADMQAMQMQMQMGMGQQANAQFDAKKEYTGERDAMRVFRHRWRPAAVERNLVGFAPVPDDD